MGMSAQKFLNDLNAEILEGWTSHGQTNRIVGRIALREFVFHHAIHGGEPLKGFPLIDRIVEVAIGLPGYERWCRHQSEIFICAEYWARCVEMSEYYPYKGKALSARLSEERRQNWNIKQSEEAKAKIRAGVAQLIQENRLPERPTARADALKEFGLSPQTLYRHKALWHPDHLELAPEETVHPTQAIEEDPRSSEPLPDETLHPTDTISFYMGCSEDAPKAHSSNSTPLEVLGGFGGFSTARGIEAIHQMIGQIASRQIQPPPPDDSPPDEHWFRQANLWQSMAEEVELDE